MKAEGADNAREAFQFLALALGLVLALRLGYWGLDRWMAPSADDGLGQALVPFRAGYLVDDRTLVLAARPLLERLGVAVLLAIAAAALLAVLGAVFARATGNGPVKWSARAARWTLLISFPMLVFGALARPSMSLHIAPSGISLKHRPFPFLAFNSSSEHWSWQDIEGFTLNEGRSDDEGTGLALRTGGGSPITLLEEHDPTSDLQELAEQLEAERISHQAAR